MNEAHETITAEQKQRASAALSAMPLSNWMGMELVDILPGEAIIRMEMRDDLRQPGRLLHGGVTATLIDTAMAFAARTRLAEHEATATIDLTIHYLRPHTEGTIICSAKIVREGRRIITLSAQVENGEGKLIATALSTYTRL